MRLICAYLRALSSRHAESEARPRVAFGRSRLPEAVYDARYLQRLDWQNVRVVSSAIGRPRQRFRRRWGIHALPAHLRQACEYGRPCRIADHPEPSVRTVAPVGDLVKDYAADSLTDLFD